MARLPAGVHVPEEFPVLIRINPRPDVVQALRGRLSLEVETDDIDFLWGTPLRLFQAPGGAGAFQDISQGLGAGSFRARGSAASFAEFLIAADQRPVNDIVAAKLARLRALLAAHRGDIDPSVWAQVQAGINQIDADQQQDLLTAAIAGVDAFAALVQKEGGTGIPDIWQGDSGPANVAGRLAASAATLRFSLALLRSPLAGDPADVNRDGKVDVGDVLILIDRVFGDTMQLVPRP